jgi:hypothetical protein
MSRCEQMPPLVSHQKAIVERVLGLILHSYGYPSILFMGSTGRGKRTVARGIANALGMDFIEIPLDGPSKNLREQLYGSATDAEIARVENRPPGELGRAESVLLYLSRLEQLPIDLHREVFSLVTRRFYDDERGHRWKLADDVLIVSAVDVSNTSGAEFQANWLTTGFRHRIEIALLSSISEMKEIARSILDDMGYTAELDEEAVRELLMATRHSQRGLVATREWLWDAVDREVQTVEGRISVEAVRVALDRDLEMTLRQLEYRGAPVTIENFNRWRDQFPLERRHYAQQIVKSIAADYYVSANLYFNLLHQLVESTGLRTRSWVMFCRWQKIGQSSEHVNEDLKNLVSVAAGFAHDLKNIAGWQVGPDVDILREPSFWPDVDRSERHNFVLTDDFVGSGKTMGNLFTGTQDGPVMRLLSEFPESQIWILIVAGYADGLSKIRGAIRNEPRIHLIIGRLFDEEDRCLSSNSKIFPFEEDRQNVKALCKQIRTNFYPRLPANFTYGFRDIASLVVYYNTVPNNSLPLLWHNLDDWFPLFPASGLLQKG